MTERPNFIATENPVPHFKMPQFLDSEFSVVCFIRVFSKALYILVAIKVYLVSSYNYSDCYDNVWLLDSVYSLLLFTPTFNTNPHNIMETLKNVATNIKTFVKLPYIMFVTNRKINIQEHNICNAYFIPNFS